MADVPQVTRVHLETRDYPRHMSAHDAPAPVQSLFP